MDTYTFLCLSFSWLLFVVSVHYVTFEHVTEVGRHTIATVGLGMLALGTGLYVIHESQRRLAEERARERAREHARDEHARDEQARAEHARTKEE